MSTIHNMIVIKFEKQPDIVEWRSCGWGGDKAKMEKARAAIAQGDSPTEVIQALEAAGFEVVIEN